MESVMHTTIKTARGLLVLMALTAPFTAMADTCRFEQTGRIILTPAQTNPNVAPLKEAVKMRGGQPQAVNLQALIPLIYERNAACATLPNGVKRPGWETPQRLTQAIADLNSGGATNLNWISFVERIQSSGLRLPGFEPKKTVAATQKRAAAKPKKTVRAKRTAPTNICGLCTADGLN
jgi:hypothetical protein